MKKSKSQSIIEFLQSHPLISVNALEKMCNIPQSTINKAFSGSREIPDVHINNLEAILKKYGHSK